MATATELRSPVKVSAYAAASAGAPLEPTTIERRDLRPHDILIDIKVIKSVNFGLTIYCNVLPEVKMG